MAVGSLCSAVNTIKLLLMTMVLSCLAHAKSPFICGFSLSYSDQICGEDQVLDVMQVVLLPHGAFTNKSAKNVLVK